MSSLPQATGQCPPREGESGQGAGAVGRWPSDLWQRNSLWKKSWGTSLSPSHPGSLMVLPAARAHQDFLFFSVLFSKATWSSHRAW